MASMTLQKLIDDPSGTEVDPQTQSPLFSVIPGEIRNAIFELALSEYEDPERKYDVATYYYRPGYTARKRIATQLLLTCRRVWLETRHLPSSLSEHAWWLCSYDRRPPGKDPRLLVEIVTYVH